MNFQFLPTRWSCFSLENGWFWEHRWSELDKLPLGIRYHEHIPPGSLLCISGCLNDLPYEYQAFQEAETSMSKRCFFSTDTEFVWAPILKPMSTWHHHKLRQIRIIWVNLIIFHQRPISWNVGSFGKTFTNDVASTPILESCESTWNDHLDT